MATRYSGDVKVSVLYRDQGDYRAVVSAPGEKPEVVFVRPAASGFGRGVAYDSPEAYDEIARSAISLANRPFDDRAEFGDSGLVVRRTQGGAFVGTRRRTGTPRKKTVTAKDILGGRR